MKLSAFISACVFFGASCLTFAMDNQKIEFEKMVKTFIDDKKFNFSSETIERYATLFFEFTDWEILDNESESVKILSKWVLEHAQKQARTCNWYKNVWTGTMLAGLVGLGVGCFGYFAKPEYQISFLKSDITKGVIGLGSLALITLSSYKRNECLNKNREFPCLDQLLYLNGKLQG